MSQDPAVSIDDSHDSTGEVSMQESSQPAAEKTEGSCLGALFTCFDSIVKNILGLAFLLVIVFIVYSRFTYVSIRFLDDSENLEATVYRWWGLKDEVFSLQLRNVDGTHRWMYGDVKGRLESINYNDRFTSPFIVRFPWKNDAPEDPPKTDTTVNDQEASEPAS